MIWNIKWLPHIWWWCIFSLVRCNLTGGIFTRSSFPNLSLNISECFFRMFWRNIWHSTEILLILSFDDTGDLSITAATFWDLIFLLQKFSTVSWGKEEWIRPHFFSILQLTSTSRSTPDPLSIKHLNLFIVLIAAILTHMSAVPMMSGLLPAASLYVSGFG